MKTLDAKLAAIHADPVRAKAFILADAKDPDMAFGLAATGVDPVTGRPRSLAEFRDQIREIVRQGLVDIMLMSASTNDLLAAGERLFDGSPVTPAVRGNDTTDIHVLAGAPYPKQPSRPFRTARVDEIRRGGTDLALYSITPCGDAERDAAALEAYRAFRAEAEPAGLRHFLEVFPPNVPAPIEDVGRFLNDFVARTLAGVPGSGRPVFLKLPYLGPQRPGRTRGLRSASRGRRPRRVGRDDVRRLPPPRRGPSSRRASRALRPQDQPRRAPAHVRSLPAGCSRTATPTRPRRAAPITGTSNASESGRTGRWKRI